jgi:hypothetical protein
LNNDHIASTIAGTFLGELLFRMASLLVVGAEDPGQHHRRQDGPA